MLLDASKLVAGGSIEVQRQDPRLFKKFNYRVVWADTAKGPTSLRVENYAHSVSWGVPC